MPSFCWPGRESPRSFPQATTIQLITIIRVLIFCIRVHAYLQSRHNVSSVSSKHYKQLAILKRGGCFSPRNISDISAPVTFYASANLAEVLVGLVSIPHTVASNFVREGSICCTFSSARVGHLRSSIRHESTSCYSEHCSVANGCNPKMAPEKVTWRSQLPHVIKS